MKKLIVGATAALITSAGLVSVTTSSSTGATAACPYTGCVRTVTNLRGAPHPRKGTTKTYRADADARRGTANPKGVMHLSASGPGCVDVSSQARDDSDSLRVKFNKAGKRCTITARFDGKGAFRDSSDSMSFLVSPAPGQGHAFG